MKTLTFLIVFLNLIFSNNILASELVEVPAQWRVDYSGSADPDIVVFYSGSTCPSGTLRLSAATFGVEGKDLFWNIVMASKVSDRKLRVFYTDDGACSITMFGLPNDAV